MREWLVPSPRFARDRPRRPTAASDPVMSGNKLALRSQAQAFREWDSVLHHARTGCLINKGVVRPRATATAYRQVRSRHRKVTEYRPSAAAGHTLVISDDGARSGSRCNTATRSRAWTPGAARSASTRPRAGPTASRSTRAATSGSAAWATTAWAGSTRGPAA